MRIRLHVACDIKLALHRAAKFSDALRASKISETPGEVAEWLKATVC